MTRPRRPASTAITLGALVTAVYISAAKLGIELPVAHGVITPVWAPTGIAVGNTLEAVVGAYLLRRVGFRTALDRVRDVLAFVVLASMVATTVSATNGVTVLWLADALVRDTYASGWLLWWLGDAMGALLVAPPLLVLLSAAAPRLNARRALEAAALAAALTGLSALVFLGGGWRYPYLLFPLLIWATLRFHQAGAAVGGFLVAAIAVLGMVSGTIPLGAGSVTEGVQMLQLLIAVVIISLLVLGATLAERARSDRELEQALATLAEAQALAHIGSWEWDIRRDRVTWSDELYRIFGLEPQSVEIDYGSFVERVDPEDRELVRATIGRSLDTHEPFEFNQRIVLPDGSIRAVHSRGRVLLDHAGEPVRMVGTAQDVTERRRIDDLRDSILLAVSHELRTPLTSILGFALTLQARRRQLSEEQVEQAIGAVAAHAGKLDVLLSDLLDLDRLRRGLSQAMLRPTDVGELVEKVAASYNGDAQRINVRADSVVAEVDAAKVERIVDNLLANAIKHTPPGTGIEVEVARENGGVQITVADDGPGVPDEFKEAVFEVFQRGAAAGSAPGTGVGLALVQQFTALHGGRVWVEDKPGGGARFCVVLPARPQR